MKRLDVGYFSYAASAHAAGLLVAADQHRSALALRVAYGQGIECFLSLLFATLQAPDAILPWLAQYRVEDVRALASSALDRRPWLTKFIVKPFDFDGISDLVCSFVLDDPAKRSAIVRGFAQTWTTFARDFTDPDQSVEYNAAKHAQRLVPTGSTLSLGVETQPGVPAPSDRMRTIINESFGSWYVQPEELGHPRVFRLKATSVGWSPEGLTTGLLLLSMSIQNVVSFARLVSGHPPSECEFVWPTPHSVFDEFRSRVCRTSAVSFNEFIERGDVPRWDRGDGAFESYASPIGELRHGY